MRRAVVCVTAGLAAVAIGFGLSYAIPALRDDPKLVGRDDTKVVGDSVAKAVPFFGNSSPEEAQVSMPFQISPNVPK